MFYKNITLVFRCVWMQNMVFCLNKEGRYVHREIFELRKEKAIEVFGILRG